jgi:alkylhydroperoxidase family enzyme
MKPMFLRDVENRRAATGPYAKEVESIVSSDAEVPQILHLFAFKPEVTEHLERFSHAVMRGPSPLSPGLRELIAAFTSKRNLCPF